MQVKATTTAFYFMLPSKSYPSAPLQQRSENSSKSLANTLNIHKNNKNNSPCKASSYRPSCINRNPNTSASRNVVGFGFCAAGCCCDDSPEADDADDDEYSRKLSTERRVSWMFFDGWLHDDDEGVPTTLLECDVLGHAWKALDTAAEETIVMRRRLYCTIVAI